MKQRAGRDIGLGATEQSGDYGSRRREGFTVSGVLLAVAVVIAGIAALAIAFAGGSVDRASDITEATVGPTAAPDVSQPTSSPTGERETTVVAPTPTPTSVLDGIGEADFADYSARVAGVFDQEIDDEASQFGVAYVSDDIIVLLSRNGAVVPQRTVATNLGVVSVLPLLTNDVQTWAIDPRGEGVAYLVTSSFVVVRSARLNTLAVYDPRSGEVELLASGQPAPGIELPEDVNVLAVQRRGLLALPRTGGTYEVDGLAGSLRRIDDGRAIAASLQATVFQRCDDQLRCDLVLRRIDEEDEQILPLDFGQPLSVSPTGEWVVQHGGDANLIMSTKSGEVFELQAGPVHAVSWEATGEFVALLRADTIEMFFPAEFRSVKIDLVVPSERGALMVYASNPG